MRDGIKKNWDFFRWCPQYAMHPQLQSTCHYIIIHYVKIWHVRLGDENNMHPLSWGKKMKRSKICLENFCQCDRFDPFSRAISFRCSCKTKDRLPFTIFICLSPWAGLELKKRAFYGKKTGSGEFMLYHHYQFIYDTCSMVL